MESGRCAVARLEDESVMNPRSAAGLRGAARIQPDYPTGRNRKVSLARMWRAANFPSSGQRLPLYRIVVELDSEFACSVKLR